MTDLASARKMIQQEETIFRYGVSESFAQKLGAAVNFINTRQYSEKQFFANGTYGRVAMPQTGIDGLTVFEFAAEIIGVWAFRLTAGSGGTTELDIKRATAPGGAFTSIFSTTPKFTPTAGNNAWIGLGETLSGATAPVLASANVDAGDALRFDIIQDETGDPRNCGVLIHYRPR